MLTVMCPNCRHRFPAPGCCNPNASVISGQDRFNVHPAACNDYYGATVSGFGGGYLVPRGYSSGGGCIINAPTIIHSPTIIQAQNIDFKGQNVFTNVAFSDGQEKAPLFRSPGHQSPIHKSQNEQVHLGMGQYTAPQVTNGSFPIPPHCQIANTCDQTGGSVTISTPEVQSGGCLIRTSDGAILVQTPQIEIRPNLSGGGCMVQKQMSIEEECEGAIEQEPSTKDFNMQQGIFQNPHPMLFGPPSGCQELPGARRSPSPRETDENSSRSDSLNSCAARFNYDAQSFNCRENVNASDEELNDRNLCRGAGVSNASSNFIETCSNVACSGATVQSIRPSISSAHNVTNLQRNCTCFGPAQDSTNSDRGQNASNCHNETNGGSNFSKMFVTTEANASTSAGAVIQVNATLQLPPNVGRCTVSITATANASPGWSRARNNFNGGGIIQPETISNVNVAEKEDASPTTPVSWVLPFPWALNNSSGNNSGDLERLSEAQRVLQISGWYHEGLSWQQSENLLKNASVGSWLMRDSSDRRFMYAVSVQTARGATSVRVHYVCGRFRLDAEPSLAQYLPMFECPIKMIEHYIEYSKKMEEHREVWVDHSGQLYSQIYLTKPLFKEVRSLSHLARLAVNRSKISTEVLPTPLREYIEEYPYTQ